jgi:hypothetical protein
MAKKRKRMLGCTQSKQQHASSAALDAYSSAVIMI